MLLFMLLCYVLIHDLLGGTLLAHCPWDSYTLQAQAWLDGRTDLGQDISYLELAIYNGKYYVSFPPFPSAVMLPFVLIFGTDTPNNLIIMIITLLIAAAAFKLCGYAGYDAKDSAILGAFHNVRQQPYVDEHYGRRVVFSAEHYDAAAPFSGNSCI